ncbi:RING-H2 finger protein ATL8 [Manihot esculenta]|uniref:RING-type domain-containing protein n=1 Tax=Manihot esculenta TaxID=3983 RepID=A0A2C9VXV2_MANES|nr:RING-H2 finger protein ATL8 [Manihot esculenta]OAY50311.1 hypothetical protein MANES_05G126000v8 [Manihot esculenta]
MTRPFRFLGAVNSSATTTNITATSESTDQTAALDSDFVVILAALLCALICVLGLIAVARCAWLRRLSSTANSNALPQPSLPSAANKGLKKKILRTLPKQTFSADSAAKFTDCAICLTEFATGDEIRVLPQCGHGFHLNCIDMWLGSHSSCPSCRQILVVTRCQKCGGLPASSSSGADTEARLKEREDSANRC